MEGEEKVTKKKNNLPMLVILLAVVLIGAGVFLYMNDKDDSLKGDEETPEAPEKVVPRKDLTNEDAKSFLDEYKANNLPEETWTIENVEVLGEGLDFSYLVHYTRINEDGTTEDMETVLVKGDDGTTVELPGWHVGEKDLKEYNFTLYSEETVDPTQPEGEQPTEPTDENQPAGGEVPSVDPTQPEGEQPTEPVEQQPTETTPEVPQE